MAVLTLTNYQNDIRVVLIIALLNLRRSFVLVIYLSPLNTPVDVEFVLQGSAGGSFKQYQKCFRGFINCILLYVFILYENEM